MTSLQNKIPFAWLEKEQNDDTVTDLLTIKIKDSGTLMATGDWIHCR